MNKHAHATLISQEDAWLIFFQAMCHEARLKQTKHGSYHSHHEALGVALEEWDEVKEQVVKRDHERDDAVLLREWMQTASIAMRAAYECGLFAGYSGVDDPALRTVFLGDRAGADQADADE